MEGVDTHQKFLIPLSSDKIHKKSDISGTVTLLIAGHLNWGTHLTEESSLCSVKLWPYPPRQSLDMWNRWFMNEIKSPCLEIQVDIRESWQIQAKEKLEMLLLFRLHLQIGLTWRHSQINSRILQLSKLIGS